MKFTTSFSVGGNIVHVPQDDIGEFSRLAKEHGERPEIAYPVRISDATGDHEAVVPHSEFGEFERLASENGAKITPLQRFTTNDGKKWSVDMDEAERMFNGTDGPYGAEKPHMFPFTAPVGMNNAEPPPQHGLPDVILPDGTNISEESRKDASEKEPAYDPAHPSLDGLERLFRLQADRERRISAYAGPKNANGYPSSPYWEASPETRETLEKRATEDIQHEMLDTTVESSTLGTRQATPKEAEQMRQQRLYKPDPNAKSPFMEALREYHAHVSEGVNGLVSPWTHKVAGLVKETGLLLSSFGADSAGNALVDVGRDIDKWTYILFRPDLAEEESVVSSAINKGVGVMSEIGSWWVATKFGGRAGVAGLTLSANANTYVDLYDTAVARGASPEEAGRIATLGGAGDAAVTLGFAMAPIHRIAKAFGFSGEAWAQSGVKKAIGKGWQAIKRAMGIGAAKQMLTNAAFTTVEMGGLSAASGGFNEAMRQEARGEPLDWDKIKDAAKKSGVESAALGAFLSLLPTPAKVKETVKAAERTMSQLPHFAAGREILAHNAPDALADFLNTYEQGGAPSRKQLNDVGIPDSAAPTAADRVKLAKLFETGGYKSKDLRTGKINPEGSIEVEATVVDQPAPAEPGKGEVVPVEPEPVKPPEKPVEPVKPPEKPVESQKPPAETPKNGPESVPPPEVATTPPEAAEPPQGGKPAENAAPVLSGDEVRKTMPGYDPKDWRTHVDKTGYVAPRMEAEFQRLLKDRKGKGNGEVMFLAGGNGSGKSTVANAEGAEADFIIDSTLGNLEVAKKQIDAVLANGQKPRIAFVYRTPEQALEGVVERVENGGHAVSPLSFADSHTKGIKNLRLLSDEYGDRISVQIFDNSEEGMPKITLEQLEAKGIPDHAELRARANEVLGKYGRGLGGSLGARSVDGSGAEVEGAQGGEGRETDGTGDVEPPAPPPKPVNKGKGKKPPAPAKPQLEPKRTFVDDSGKTHEVTEDISRQLRQKTRSEVNLICNTKNKTSIENARKQVERVAASMTNDDLSASLAGAIREERRNTTGGKASDILIEEAKRRGLEVAEKPEETPHPGEWIVGRVDGDSAYTIAGRVLSADARGIVVQYYGGHNKVRAGKTVGEEMFKALVPTDAVDLAIRDPSRPAKSFAKSPAVAAADDFIVRNTTLSRDGAAVANDDINHQGEVKPPPRTEDEPRKPFAKPLKIVDAPAAAKEMAGHASQDVTRKALTGVHVEKGLMVATDGRHMVIAPAPKGWTDGEYGADGKPVGDDRVYPNWRQVVPDVKKVGYAKIGTMANGDAATDAVDFASALRKKVVAVTKYDNDGPTVAIGDATCDPSYVSDILGTMFRLGAKSVDVWYRDGKSPVVFKGRNADGEITSVLMPLRSNGESAAERGFTHVRMPLEAPKPKNKGKVVKSVQAAKPLGSPDAASPLRPAPKGAKLVQGEFDGMGGVTESVSEATRQAFAANPRTKSWEILAEPKTVSDVKPEDIAIETPLVPVGNDGATVKPQSNNAVRNSVKDVFRSFGVCENAADKNKVVFPGNSAGKMMSQSGADVAALAPHMKQLFESAVPAWYEPETTMDGHTPHPDVAGYRHYLNKFRTTDGSEFFIRFTVREGKGKGGFKGVHAATVSDVKIYESKNAEPTILVDETSRRLRAFTDNKLSDFLSTVNAENSQETLDGQTIDPTGEKTDKNPLGKALVPKDGSIEQEIDAEIAADEALAAKGGGKPQGVPPAPAPGSAGNPNLDPSYEPEAFGSGIEGNPIARQQVIDKFRELFGDKVAIRGKNTRTLGPTVAGHFEPDAHIIRSKDPISLRTIPHEIGHFIDALLRRRGLARPPAVRHDLIALGKLLYGKKQPNGGYESEGFAELLKYYMQGNDAGLRKDAPAAYDWFMNRFAPANPDTMARIDAMRDMIDRFQNQSAVQAVRGISAPDKTFGQRVVERIADIVNALKPTQENWIDKGAFITKAMKASGINRLYDWRDALKRGDVAEATRIIENHPVLKWKLYNGKAGMRAFVALKDGLTDLSGTRRYTYGDLGVTTPGHAPDEPLPTFREIFGDFTKRELDDFKHEYAIARIAKELYLDRGLEFGLTAKEVEPVLRKYANNAKFREALDRYTHYKHGVLHLLVDAGAMSQQQFEAIVDANPIYAKIARRRESTDFFRNAMLRRGGKAVNERKGGGQMIEDIFDAGLVDDERIFRAAFQADLFRSLVRAGELAEANNAAPGGALQGTFSVGANWIKEVPNAKEAVTFTPEKLRKQVVDALNAAGAEAPSNVAGQPPLRGDTLFDALFGTGDNLTIFKERPSDGKNGIVSIYGEDGKLRTFELPENNAEGWAKGLLDFTDGKNASIFEKWAEISVAGVRAGATMLNPEFALRNLMRDTFHAATMNQHGTFIPVVGSLEGLYHDLMGTAPKQMFEAMGLEMGGMLGRSRLASARKSNQYLMSSNWFEAQMRKGLTKAVADLVGVTENATRIKQFKLAYENMLRQGVSDKAARMIAGCNALDTTIDFLRSGYTGQKINRIVPFFNAGVQGLDQFARALGMLEPKAWDVKDSRFYRLGRTLLQGLAFLATAALFSELYNRSDPERKRKAEELPPHERWNYISFGDLRIPVPYEAGYLFASIPRAVAAAAIDGDEKAVSECLKMFATTFPLQVDSLHGFMRNAAFVGPLADVAFNEDWKYKTIVQQHVKDGKESWEWYGPRTTGFSKDLGKALHNVIGDSYFSAPAYLDTVFDGYTGGMYSKLARLAYGEADFSFDTSRPSDWPIIGTFFRRPESSRIPNDFYDERAKLERKAGSGTATIAEYGRLSAMDSIAKDIRPYWDANRRLMADRDMPRKERLDRMDENTRKATDAIRAMSKDEAELRSHGMKALAAKLANPSATGDSWERAAKMLKADGATLQETQSALRLYGRAHGWTRDTVNKRLRLLSARWK